LSKLPVPGLSISFGDERQDDELQSDQCARGRADDYMEAVPFGEL
jgi:hypothetical protein